MAGRAVGSPFSFPLRRGVAALKSVILERRKTKELSRLALARFAGRAQRAAGLAGEVNILLTGDAEMQRLNRQFRGKNSPTDVLSFPAELPSEGGDIAISLAMARAQAAEEGHDLLTEIKILILHGMLHLAGHDHERDRGEMRHLEQRLRAELHLGGGLIERAERGRGTAAKPRRATSRKPARAADFAKRRPR
jgi:probable rRNA maturation factor